MSDLKMDLVNVPLQVGVVVEAPLATPTAEPLGLLGVIHVPDQPQNSEDSKDHVDGDESELPQAQT